MNEGTDHTNMLGDYLRAARTRAGLSVRELERLTGVANHYLTKLETGFKTKPSAEVLIKLADALELDTSELLAFIGVNPASVLPPADIYFRKRYGMSEDQARQAAELIEERYGTATKSPQVNKPPEEVNHDE